MTLGNILKRGGGVAETGRPVKFQLRYKGKDGTWHRREVDALILPVSEEERAEFKQAADVHCDEQKLTAPDIRSDERQLRLVAAMLRDPADPRARLVPDGELHLLRRGLVHAQIEHLLEQYGRHLLGEYPEVFTREDVQQVEEQAEDFSDGASPQS